MNYYETLNKLKEEIKIEAAELRIAKADLKKMQKAGDSFAWSAMSDLRVMKERLRHRHVAYSLALGNSYEQIEPKVREGNEISWYTIEKIQEEYGLTKKEAV